ncbi:hypothetical protein HDU86_007867 [Geranomyces michiganensis]|nr:hypothetical protein HDU86_007867 [Geranomyces michiganensis]
MTRSEEPQHPYDRFFLTGLFADALVSLDTATATTAAAGTLAVSHAACASAAPVHRVVLAAHSPVLCQLLTTPPARHETYILGDCQSSVVLGVWEIPANDHVALRLVLEWCYFASLSDKALTPLNCWALRETAKELQIDALVRHVDEWIATDLLVADTDFHEDWALALKGALRSNVTDDLLARIVHAAASKSPTEDSTYMDGTDSSWEYQKYRYLRRTILRDDLGLEPHEIRRAFAVGVAFTSFKVPQLVEAHADKDLPRDIIAEALMRSLVLRSNDHDSQETQHRNDQKQQSSTYYTPIRSPESRSTHEGVTSLSPRPPPPPTRMSKLSADYPVPFEPSPAASAASLSRQGIQDTTSPSRPRQLYDDTPMSTVLARLRASSLDERMSPAPRVSAQSPDADNNVDVDGEENQGAGEEEPHPGDISTYELAAEWQDGESDSSPIRAPVPLSVPTDGGAFCGQKALSSGRCSAASASPLKRTLMGLSNAPLPESMAQIAAVTAMERRNSFGFPVPAENYSSVHNNSDQLTRKVSVGSNASAPHEASATNLSLSMATPADLHQKRHSFHGLFENPTSSAPPIVAPEPLRATLPRKPSILDKATNSSFNSTVPDDDGPMQALLEVKRQVRLLKDRAQQDSATASLPRTSYAHAVLLNGAGYDHAATVPRPGDRSTHAHAVLFNDTGYNHAATVPRPGDRLQFLDHERRRLSTPMVLAEVRRRLEGVPDTPGTSSSEATLVKAGLNDPVPPPTTRAPPTYAKDMPNVPPDFTLAPAAIAVPQPPQSLERRPRQVRKQISFADMPTLISPDTSNDDGDEADDDDEDEYLYDSNGQMLRGGLPPHRSPPPPIWDPARATPALLLGLPLDAQQALRSVTPTMDPYSVTAPPRPGDPRPPRPAKPNAPRQPNPSVAATWAGPPPAQFIPNAVGADGASVRGNEFAFLDLPIAAESGGGNGAVAGASAGNGVNGGGGTYKGSFRMLGFNAAGTVARAVKAKKRKALVDLFKSSA